MNLIFPITVFLGLIILGMFVIMISKFPKIGISFILIAFLIDMAFQGLPPSISIVGSNLYPADLLLGIVGASGVWRLINRDSRRMLSIFGPMIALVVAIVRGSTEFDLNLVINSSRVWIYLLSVVIYCAGIQWDEDRVEWFREYFNKAAILLLGIGLVWFILNFLGIASYSIYQGTFRFLPAAGALFIGQAALMNIASSSNKIRENSISILFLLAVLILQHRTIWLCILACLLALPLLDRRQTRKWMTMISALSLALVALTLIVFPVDLLESLSTSATSSGTFIWRIDGWAQLINTDRLPDFISLLFGQPMGSGYERYIDGVLVTANPHNTYIQTLLDVGLVGLLSYVYIAHVLIKAQSDSVASTVIKLIGISIIIYGFSYFTPYTSAIFFGIGLNRFNTSYKSHIPTSWRPMENKWI